jgi:hypothetical protein
MQPCNTTEKLCWKKNIIVLAQQEGPVASINILYDISF